MSVIQLVPGRRVVVGRSAAADIPIDDPKDRASMAITTASEPNGTHRLEHLSHTYSTLLGGQVVSGVITIADAAVIQIGD